MAFGVDLGSSAVKVVALRQTLSGYRLVGGSRRRLPKGLKPEERGPASIRLLQESLAGSSGRRPAVLGLTGRDVNLQVVQQPMTKPVNYRALMRYELDQRLGQGDDLYGDWCTLREADPYFPQYLAMIGLGKRAYIDDRLALAAASGFEARDAVPNAFALFAAYRQSYETEPGVLLLVDLGAENTDLAMVRGGRLIFARNVSAGARLFDAGLTAMGKMSEDEAEGRKIAFGNLGPSAEGADPREEEVRPSIRTSAGQLVGFIQSSIQFAKTQLADRELTVDKLYLSGGGARLRGLAEYLASALKVPVEPLDPFRMIDASAAEAVEGFRQIPSDLTIALGLAMLGTASGEGLARLSVVPPGIRRRRTFFSRTLQVVMAASVLAAAMAISTVMAAARLSHHQAALDRFTADNQLLSRRIEELDRLEERQRELGAKLELLASASAPGRVTLDAVAKLRKILPEGVTIRRIEWVDLSERAHSKVGKERCFFHLPGRGLVHAQILSREGDRVKLSTGEEISIPDVIGFTRWTAPAVGLQIEGEIDDNVRGGPSSALDAIREQLSDPSRGVAVEIPYQDVSRDKPGWRVFRILLRFE